MLVSLKTVSKLVDLEGLTPKQIADGLTFAGVEVEEVYPLASGTNLVVGQILECEPHPDSDHLHILKVDLGNKYGVEQIVCGAPNARKGLKVIVARVGAKLPEIEIKPSKIRGVESFGMCCSLLELGVDHKFLSESQTKGIEELPNSATVGDENVFAILGLDDTVLNLKILANRPDLLSVNNVAREIGAIFNRKVTIDEINSVNEFETEFKVNSLTDKCSQFAIKEIKNIKIHESPLWLKEALMAMGIRSINNIVDIGNYVMLMTGQPLHMYDADKLPKKKLVARSDYQGEFIALDGNSYELIPGDIVISSKQIPQCLGGVMGGKNCEVDPQTTHIVIESASFDGATIRHTSNRLGLASESSSRFVKGTNHFQAEYVLNYASQLIKELCNGTGFSEIKEYQKEEMKNLKISSSVDRINNRLGTSFTAKDIKSVLERLNFKIMMNSKGGNFIAVVPNYRLDVTCDADLSEEVIRLLGYENVKSVLPCLDTKVGMLTLKQRRLKEIRYFLLDSGLDECVTYSLVSRKEINKFNLLNNEEHYEILNPLTDDRVCFRTHILNSLLKVCSYNVARQNKDLALFETSHMQSKISRSEHLAICLVGNHFERGIMQKTPYDFYHIKGLVEGIFTLLGIEKSRYRFEKLDSHLEEMHPGKSAKIIFQNQTIGVMGELHPYAIEDYGLGKNSAVVLEINLDPLLDSKVSTIKAEQISKFPTIERDLAFVVCKEILARDIIKTIKKTGQGMIKDAQVFDVYTGKGIDENKKSMAVKIYYSSNDHTLVDKEVIELETKIKYELLKNFKAELRI